MKTFFLPVLLLSVCISSCAGPPVQLIQSTPEGTSLKDPLLADTVKTWSEMIHQARKEIDLAQFYLYTREDPALEPVVQELIEATHRGVRIRILLSPNLKQEDPEILRRLQTLPRIELRFLDLSKLTHGIQHAKYMIVDHHEVFVGSQNFDWRAMTQIHETGVRLEVNEITEKLSLIFESDWILAKSGILPRKAPSSFPPSWIAASPPELNPPGIEPAIQALLRLIHTSRSSLRIVVMSYSLDDRYDPNFRGKKWTEINDALQSAARRGVQIQLMISDWGTDPSSISDLKVLSKTPGVAVKIVSIPELPDRHIPFARVTHSKFMVVDDQTLWLGTSNWERGYFYGSRNVELILPLPKLSLQAKAVFTRLWQSKYAEPLDPEKIYIPRKKN